MTTKPVGNLPVIAVLIGSVAGIGLTFYIIGFTVVQSYFYGNNLEGLFVLSHEFYEAAGVRFMLEMIRAPLWSPHVVGPYLLLLVYLIPKPSDKVLESIRDLEKWQLVRFFVLLLILAGTYFYCLYYNRLFDTTWFVPLLQNLVINPITGVDPSAEIAFGFFALATPMLVAASILLWRFRTYSRESSLLGYIYKSAIFLLVAYLAMLPIAYGFHVYDWKVVEVDDPSSVQGLLTEEESENRRLRIWLIGEFGERFVFVKRDGLDEFALIAALEKDQVKKLHLATTQASPLKVALGRID